MGSRIARNLLCGAAVCMAWPSIALAQSAPEEKPASSPLGDIVVTATRSETNLQDTPVAITAFSAEELSGRGVKDLRDVATYTPNLSVIGRAGSGGQGGSVAIRGMGVDAGESSAAVGTYIDDVYFAAGRGNILGLLDMKRIEVLRGPQGTLFGRNTIAGAIQYVTEDPGPELGGYISGAAGNFKRADIEGALNVPVSDTLSIRFAGKYNSRGGYVHDLLNDIDRGSLKSIGARVKVRWTPTDRLTVDLKAEYVEMKTNGNAVLIDKINPNAQFPALAKAFGVTDPFDDRYLSTNFHPGDFESAGFNADDYFRFKGYTAQGIIRYDLTDDISIKSITARAWYSPRLAWDGDDTPHPTLAVGPAEQEIATFTQELQLQGNVADGRLHFTVGAYYYDEDNVQDPGLTVQIGLLPPALAYGSPAVYNKALAGYGQVDFHVTDSLTATAGIRYSHEKISANLIGDTPLGSVTYEDWSPHFGLDLKVTDDILLYAKASKGFRAGGFTANYALIPDYPSGNRPFDPETAWTYEIGARMEFLDHRLRFNPTIFLTDWKNIQFQSIDVYGNTPVAGTKNAGDARLKGFELETEFAVTDNLTLSGSLALLSAHYTRVDPIYHTIFPTGWTGPVPNSVEIVPDLLIDNEIPQTPDVKFTIGARYEYPLANDARITANVDYSWTDRQTANVMRTAFVELPSVGLLNARLGYSAPDNRFNISIYGRNLTNEYYLVGGTDFAAGYTSGVRELDPGIPREFGVEARFNF